MELIQFKLNLAFVDASCPTVDAVRSRIVQYITDGLEAEVAFTSGSSQRRVRYPDPDFESDESIEAWQDRARKELDEPTANG